MFRVVSSPMDKFPDHKFCVAPMMDWTDRHERYFLRLISRRAFLYTEMITSAALLHGDADYLLHYDQAEHPLGIQLGGSDPAELTTAAQLAEKAGYREINLNIGCPSERVQSGSFGACLMLEPDLVADCVAAIRDRVQLPVTVKCRIGVDQQDSEEFLSRFIATVAQAGCELFIIHARIAVLRGLTPKENREIPPLNYARVFRIKESYPQLNVVINGGITNLEQGQGLLEHVDGIMVGREAYGNPYALRMVDRLFYDEDTPAFSRLEYLERYLPYIEKELARGTPLHHMTRHILGLFRGTPGGRAFRRHLSEHACRRSAGINVLLEAMTQVGHGRICASP